MVKEYRHIEDFAIEWSHQSIGLQLADYVCGSINGAIRGYTFSKDLYFTYLKRKVRKIRNSIFGYGIIEVPTDSEVRADIKNSLYLEENEIPF